MTSLFPLPTTLDTALSPEWLNVALGQRFPGIDITGVTITYIDQRVSTNALFTIECASGVPDGLSQHLCIKGYFDEEGAPYAHIGEGEARFYDGMAQAIGLRTLTAPFSVADPETGGGIFITEDVAIEGGDFLSSLSPYSIDQTAKSLTEFARLHAWGWGLPDAVQVDWLAPKIHTYWQHRTQQDIQENFDGWVGEEVHPDARDAARLYAAMKIIADRQPGPGWTLIHGDAHVGNILIAPDGDPSLVDWQLVQRNFYGIDVGYHIASALTTEDREKAERDLVQHYLDELQRFGVNDAPGWDDMWEAYRLGTVYGYYMWGITKIVKPPKIRVLLQRLSAAVAAHDSFTAIEGA